MLSKNQSQQYWSESFDRLNPKFERSVYEVSSFLSEIAKIAQNSSTPISQTLASDIFSFDFDKISRVKIGGDANVTHISADFSGGSIQADLNKNGSTHLFMQLSNQGTYSVTKFSDSSNLIVTFEPAHAKPLVAEKLSPAQSEFSRYMG